MTQTPDPLTPATASQVARDLEDARATIDLLDGPGRQLAIINNYLMPEQRADSLDRLNIRDLAQIIEGLHDAAVNLVIESPTSQLLDRVLAEHAAQIANLTEVIEKLWASGAARMTASTSSPHGSRRPDAKAVAAKLKTLETPAEVPAALTLDSTVYWASVRHFDISHEAAQAAVGHATLDGRINWAEAWEQVSQDWRPF